MAQHALDDAFAAVAHVVGVVVVAAVRRRLASLHHLVGRADNSAPTKQTKTNKRRPTPPHLGHKELDQCSRRDVQIGHGRLQRSSGGANERRACRIDEANSCLGAIVVIVRRIENRVVCCVAARMRGEPHHHKAH